MLSYNGKKKVLDPLEISHLKNNTPLCNLKLKMHAYTSKNVNVGWPTSGFGREEKKQ